MDLSSKLDRILFESHPVQSLEHLVPANMSDFIEVLYNRADANEIDITIREMSKRRESIHQYAEVWNTLRKIMKSPNLQENEKFTLNKIISYIKTVVQTAAQRDELPPEILKLFGAE